MRSKPAKGWSKLSKRARQEVLSTGTPGGSTSTAAIRQHAERLSGGLAAELKTFADKNARNF